MKATAIESVELVSYRLQDITVNWYESWELSRGEDAPPAVWQEFTEAFLRHYLPLELRRARVDRFLTLLQGNMSVREYSIQFDSLAKYAPTIPSMDISCIQAYAQGVEERHVMRDCPTRGGASIVQPSRSVVCSSSSVRPPRQGSQAPIARGRGRVGASSSSGPQNCINALAGRQDQESSPDIVTEPVLVKPFEVSTPVEDLVIARRVYRDCTVVVHSRSTVVDLIELDMAEFDVILGMDWFASCYANIDCRSKDGSIPIPRGAFLEWKGHTTSPGGRFISYLKARKMIRKGYIYHLVRVQDVKVESPTIQSIPLVNEFPNVFPNELPGHPPEREIEFAIDLLPDTQPISIPR
ncbi:uncharacterized protein [Nicotiana tomentosiformis]|uniref:uncharacterized protein n=1 Tax=Nicotiana tomentosiformis TaxID=4098 RepID=UPI00388C7B1E